ncbi:MAG: PrgI family protein [bacterium]
MQYQVPQFIEVESKIFGPLTVRQFVYLGGSFGAVLLLYYFLKQIFLSVLIGLPVIVLGLTLAFYKVNSRPFAYTLEAAVKYFFSKKLYLWKVKAPVKDSQIEAEKNMQAIVPISTNSQARLKQLTWSLNIANAQKVQEKKQK